jgi:hypothetical protein
MPGLTFRHLYRSPCHLPFALFLWSAISTALLAAAEPTGVCALTLNVTSARGVPIASTWVELRDASNRIELREMITGPTARICDFGFGTHTLHVGTNECYPVTISNLRVDLLHPVTLDVILNECAGGHYAGNACLLYFRVRDAAGGPVPDATISRTDGTAAQQTDSYGRLQLPFSGRADFTFTRVGFESRVVRVECQTARELDMEVVLTPERGERRNRAQ